MTDELLDIRQKREFIYLLDNEYYLLGSHVCEKITDEELIKKYKTYLNVTDCSDFNACQEMDDVRLIPDYIRNTIADAYDVVDHACRVAGEKSSLTQESLAMYNRLEERYPGEIKNQIRRWLIARTCAFYRDAHKKSDG